MQIYELGGVGRGGLDYIFFHQFPPEFLMPLTLVVEIV